ncbi:hypothetical protein LAZ67_13000632 [Cordylochernes scorpioides]|uniref:Uncharacterized protein n=1 Tax=Cordylochernes scorpioides TaxID=51811 RepID=A0ABY6L350_9ARAC|nr:hypothetical protein LAZ67_13000632 [Cordylochernes scorpioides]
MIAQSCSEPLNAIKPPPKFAKEMIAQSCSEPLNAIKPPPEYANEMIAHRPSVQRIFFNLPDEKENYEQTKMILDKYFTPHKNVLTERSKYRQRVQKKKKKKMNRSTTS